MDVAGPTTFVIYICAIPPRDIGVALSAFNTFLFLQGVEPLSLHLECHAENTKKVAKYLINYPQVEKVNRPSLPAHLNHALYMKYFPNGGAGMFTFGTKDGQEEGRRFMNSLKFFSLFTNVTNVKGFTIHPSPFPTLLRRIAGIGHQAEYHLSVHQHRAYW